MEEVNKLIEKYVEQIVDLNTELYTDEQRKIHTTIWREKLWILAETARHYA